MSSSVEAAAERLIAFFTTGDAHPELFTDECSPISRCPPGGYRRAAARTPSRCGVGGTLPAVG